MALEREIEFIDQLYNKYQNKVILCSICNKQVPFRKFILQVHNQEIYCSKRCREKTIEKPKHFSSKTEQAIYVFLKLNYPENQVHHNIIDFIPPYEIDFSIDDLYIEYNGSMHISTKKKGYERKIEKTRINDKVKKEIICKDKKKSLIRVWAEIGLYTRPKLFDKVLKTLKENITYVQSLKDKTVCVEICIDKDENICTFEDRY